MGHLLLIQDLMSAVKRRVNLWNYLCAKFIKRSEVSLAKGFVDANLWSTIGLWIKSSSDQ